MNQQGAGRFVVSLDFELRWGVRDRPFANAYRDNLLGVRQAIPAILSVFDEYGIHATWATVGMLFCADRIKLEASLPSVRPRYREPRIDPYAHLDEVGRDEATDPLHFGATLLARIRETPNQEIATHTFSHYYALEAGQDEAAFRADLEAARALASQAGVELRSIVFPRNQVNEAYLTACHELGLWAFRGPARGWLYRARADAEERPVARALRLLDAYLPLTDGTYASPRPAPPIRRGERPKPLDIPASRFLRPYSRRLALLEPLKVRRVLAELRHAARARRIYHLWWHPHNFGVNLAANVAALRRICQEAQRLSHSHGLRSVGMGELADELARDELGGAT